MNYSLHHDENGDKEESGCSCLRYTFKLMLSWAFVGPSIAYKEEADKKNSKLQPLNPAQHSRYIGAPSPYTLVILI